MAKNRVVFAGLLALGLIVFSCKKTEKITTTASNEFSTTPVSITTIFPASFGIPNLPMDNQLTEEGIYLGRYFFTTSYYRLMKVFHAQVAILRNMPSQNLRKPLLVSMDCQLNEMQQPCLIWPILENSFGMGDIVA